MTKPVDENFFKTWTKEMAYIFGFWIADGSMGKKRNEIFFVNKDYYLITLIKFKLKSEHKIYKDRDDVFRLQIGSKTMYNDLLKLGGTPVKSLTIQFPEVPDKFLPDFIRGFFDGDGGFYIQKRRYKTNYYEYLGAYFIGNIDFLTSLKHNIKENTGINANNPYIKNRNIPNCSQRIYNLTYSGKKAVALGDYIYQDSENLRLERKFKIYNDIL